MSPEPEASHEYLCSAVLDNNHIESDSDFMPDDLLRCLNAWRAADFDWIKSHTGLFYQYLIDENVNKYGLGQISPDISATDENRLRYLTDSEITSLRTGISLEELIELLADVDKRSAVYGHEYDSVQVEYEPDPEKATPLACSDHGATPAIGEEDRKEEREQKNKKKRCHICRKRVGLTGFDCRCGGHYCSLHRYSDTHECTFDYIEHGKDKIRKDNPVIMGEKIRKI